MMHLFINSLAASAGGGLTYIRNVLPLLAARPDLRVTVALSPELHTELSKYSNVEFVELDLPAAVRRYWYEQSVLPGLIERSGADVLLSTGNFALRKSPVYQILLSRNSIYTSADFYRDLRARHEYRAWLDTRVRSLLAKKSIEWADVTVAPSEAFAAELRRWTGAPVVAVHHGFDHETFARSSAPLPEALDSTLKALDGQLKFLFVSHYNYYRNFETLIRALPALRVALAGRSFKLLLTCRLEPGKNPGAYNPQFAASLVRQHNVADSIVELGSVPYDQLHALYKRADIYITPAYTETFAHPLVEAMASGVPVVASDIAVHREICGDAAVYFPPFSAPGLAKAAANLASSPDTMAKMASAGLQRSLKFSWKTHVTRILELCAYPFQSTETTEVERSSDTSSARTA